MDDVLDLLKSKLELIRMNKDRIDKIEVVNTKNLLEFRVILK